MISLVCDSSRRRVRSCWRALDSLRQRYPRTRPPARRRTPKRPVSGFIVVDTRFYCRSNTLLSHHSFPHTFFDFDIGCDWFFCILFSFALDGVIILLSLYQQFYVSCSEFFLDDLLPPIVVQETTNCDADRPIEVRRSDSPDSDVIPQSFATRIDELNLLGEIDEEKSFVINSAKNDCEFRIDKLNLWFFFICIWIVCRRLFSYRLILYVTIVD